MFRHKLLKLKIYISNNKIILIFCVHEEYNPNLNFKYLLKITVNIFFHFCIKDLKFV